MGENSYARNLLAQRGRRTVATLLTWLESNIYEYLPAEVQSETRARVLSIIGDYQDLAMDMVASDTGTINEYWVKELGAIHDALRRIDGHLAVSDHR